jgi:HemY protein
MFILQPSVNTHRLFESHFMIRLLIVLICLALVSLGFSWVADRPGTIVIDWLGYTVETNIMIAIVAIIIAIIVVMLMWNLLMAIVHTPQAIRGFFSARKRDKGYAALSRGMIAVGAGDVSLAKRSAKTADKLLRQEPLTLLLKAQAAQLSGNHQECHKALERLTENPQTKTAGFTRLVFRSSPQWRSDDSTRLCRTGS